MAASVTPRPADLPLDGGRDGAVVEVHPMIVADMLAPPNFWDGHNSMAGLLRSAVLVPRSKWVWLPIPAFVVVHPAAGPILIDTALDASVAEDPKISLGGATGRMNRIRMTAEQAVPAQLRARGIDPADIRLVVMTHLHYDHASGVGQFPEATFVCSEREWAAASVGNFTQGYRPAQLEGASDWRTIAVTAAPAADGFEHVVDLLGDGSIRLASTPGHTNGHMSVILRTAGGELLLAGDAAYARRSIDERLVPLLITGSEAEYEDSLARLAGWLAAHPDAPAICGHDPWNRADLERSWT